MMVYDSRNLRWKLAGCVPIPQPLLTFDPMNYRPFFLSLALTLSMFSCLAQQLNRTGRRSVVRMQTHLSILSHDSLQGRRAGTLGEQKAAAYIQHVFKVIGLQPKGPDGTYLQSFSIPDGKRWKGGSYLRINGISLDPEKDFMPFSVSGNGRVSSPATLPAVAEKGQVWFIDMDRFLQDHPQHPHFDLQHTILEKAESANQKGATALIFFSLTNKETNNSWFDPKYNGNTSKIPVLYLNNYERFSKLPSIDSSYDISLYINIQKSYRSSHNVIGYLDRKAPYTLIVGAHYDHLGLGEDGNSMLRDGSIGIHNGADDNASGTTGLLELAYLYASKRSFTSYNILFIAFGAEELGLLGSKFFTDNPTINLSSVSFMMNMDMIGRLNDSTKRLTIGGYGTSPQWSSIISRSTVNHLSLSFDSSGTGPSDHTSFYRKNIPVLFFFTGLHSDYHKPSDDVDKINVSGSYAIIQLIQQIISNTNPKIPLVFSKTREQQTTTSARFSVSLGIMPDYAFSGTGVRIDGLSEGRPAKQAGILPGDVLMAVGEFKVSSVESYMQTLSKFKKGDTTKVTIQRQSQILIFDIKF
jgi:aminopeptidase YwaD